MKFDRNPFRVNAFSLTGVAVSEVRAAVISRQLENRRVDLEHAQQVVVIPAGGDKTWPVTIADVNVAADILRDPNLRVAEELLVPEPPIPSPIEGAADFKARHTLNRRAAEAFLSVDPVDLTPALQGALPPVPPARLKLQATNPGAATIARRTLSVTDLLVTARHRRG
jgi:hypothetical protein